jgi:hypothetical protein
LAEDYRVDLSNGRGEGWSNGQPSGMTIVLRIAVIMTVRGAIYFTRRRDRQHLLKIVFVGLAASLVGCSERPGWEKTHPVTGKLIYKGQPVSDAEIAFFPIASDAPNSVRPKAKTNSGGQFSVWTYARGDGAPAGSYKVTVVRHQIATSKGTLVAKPNDLPARYANKSTTNLEVEIHEGANELPEWHL